MNNIIDSDFDAPGFSVRTGYYLACASNFAYEQNRGNWTKKLGLGNNITFFTCGQFHGFVGILKNITILAFRGTQSIANCLTDLETILVSRPPYPGRVHSGFAGAVEEVLPSVQKLLPSPSRTTAVWLTGHSLGGAMATLASVRLAHAGYPVQAVYTYGSPRVGDRHFRDGYHLPNYRFVYDNDLVPHLPLLWCYKHPVYPKLLDHQGNLMEEMAAWKAKKRALASHAKRIQRTHRRKSKAHQEWIDFDWLTDHYLERYLVAIGKIARRAPRHRPLDRLCNLLGTVPNFVSTKMGLSLSPHARVLRLDPPSPGVPPPKLSHDRHENFTISEADFIAAFSQPPP